MKKEGKKLRKAIELEWMFGNSAMVHGLKYNPMTNTFQAQLIYSVKNGAWTLEEKKEIITVSEDWIRMPVMVKGWCNMETVVIHGGYVYDANEVVAIPLCKQSLDYCCSTTTGKSLLAFGKPPSFFREKMKKRNNRSLFQ
jgi:hypothetical protein